MSRVGATAYSISSSTRVCAATGREIRTGDRFVTALAQAPGSEEFVRLDYAHEAWEGGARPGAPLAMFGFWRGVAPDPAHRRAMIDDESLLELFAQTEGDPDREAFRFVLALILIRKRLLVQDGSRGANMLVRARGTPRPPEGPALVEVVDPGLDDGKIATVTEQLRAVLVGDPA